MSQPYIGEIRMVACNFPPNGWAFCDGQVLPINQYIALFDLIGTTYGGDGLNTFALPDLRSRVPMHQGSNGTTTHVIGEKSGVETVTLTTAQMPVHTHQLSATTTAAASTVARSALLASSTALQFYGSGTPATPMAAGAVSSVGNGQPHSNLAPFQAVNFIISFFGIFPSPS